MVQDAVGEMLLKHLNRHAGRRKKMFNQDPWQTVRPRAGFAEKRLLREGHKT